MQREVVTIFMYSTTSVYAFHLKGNMLGTHSKAKTLIHESLTERIWLQRGEVNRKQIDLKMCEFVDCTGWHDFLASVWT